VVARRDLDRPGPGAAAGADYVGTPFDNPLLACDAFHEVRAELRGRAVTLFSRPGVFSWDHVDEATSLLADTMEVPVGSRVLDLGCGTGGLGITAARLSRTGRVCMVDVDTEAVRSATRSAAAQTRGQTCGEQTCGEQTRIEQTAPIRVIASDVASAVIDDRFDVVVMNPPFHAGRATDLRLPERFIEDAWTVLAPGGRVFLVANRTLPYERMLTARFGRAAAVHEGPRFKVLSAVKSPPA
jgi:16S rRNA (guanine1207-N2)-methyltransferase